MDMQPGAGAPLRTRTALIAAGSPKPWYFRLGMFWEAVQDLWSVLFPMRFSIAVLLAGTALMIFVQQAQDAIYVVIADAHAGLAAVLHLVPPDLVGVGKPRPASESIVGMLRLVILYASILFWAFNSFYGARLASRLPPRGRVAAILAVNDGCPRPVHHYTPPWVQAVWLKKFNLYLPPVLGSAVVLGANAALLRASLKLGLSTSILITVTGILQFALSVWFFSHRRAVIRALARRVGNPRGLRVQRAFARDLAPQFLLPRFWRVLILSSIGAAFAVFLASAFTPFRVDTFWLALMSAYCLALAIIAIAYSNLPDSTRLTVAIEVLCIGSLFVLSLYPASAEVTRVFGAPTMVVLAAAGWAFGGTFFFAIPAELTGLPILPGMVILAVAFSTIGWRDNHVIRVIQAATQTPPAAFGPVADSPCVPLAPPSKDPTLAERKKDEAFANAFARWCRVASTHVPGDGPIPMVIVATAGGASRAAYWTEKIMGELEAKVPHFHDYVFAVSSVSGGSLGSMAYRLSLDLPPPRHVHGAAAHGADCTDGYATGDDPEACTLAMLQQDFLSALLLGGLYADLVQQTLPGGILPDRASAIEKSWEATWAHYFPDKFNLMDQGFRATANAFIDRPGEWRPLMLLNGTSVVTGRRVIVSNLPIGGGFPGAIDFFDVNGNHGILGSDGARDIPVSTATHLSARFPYLDAAGDMEGAGGIVDRVVDGGYFENFGAATAVDVLNQLITRGAVKSENTSSSQGRTVDPIVIQISNDPSVTPRGPLGDGYRGAAGTLPMQFRLLSDLSTPLLAFFDTREGVGQRAIDVLRNRLAYLLPGGDNDRRYFHFRITDLRVPMSWLLSDFAGRLIDKQLPLEHGCPTAAVVKEPEDPTHQPAANLAEFCELTALFPKPA